MKPQQAKRVKAAAAKRGRGTGHRAARVQVQEAGASNASTKRLAAASDRMAAAARDLRREYVALGNAGPDDVLSFVCCLDADTYRVHPFAGDLIGALEAKANGVEQPDPVDNPVDEPGGPGVHLSDAGPVVWKEPGSLTGDGDLRAEADALAATVHGVCGHAWHITARGAANHDGDHACSLDAGHGGDAHGCDCGAFDLTEQGAARLASGYPLRSRGR